MFDPILRDEPDERPLSGSDFNFVKTHGILFFISNVSEHGRSLPKPLEKMMREFETARAESLEDLDRDIAVAADYWMQSGTFSKPSFFLFFFNTLEL